MNRIRRVAVVAVVIPVVAAGAVGIVGFAGGDDRPASVELASSAPTFADLDELAAASDVVVLATVADVADGRTLTAAGTIDAGIRTRLVELDVIRTLAGTSSEPLIVEEPAALLDGRPVVVDGAAPSAVGDLAIWFLVAGGTAEQPYHAVVNAQGRYGVVGDTVIATTAARDDLSQRLVALGVDELVAQVIRSIPG